MSLAGYKKALDAYVGGDDAALARMRAAITPRVAAQLGDIEHRAAVHRNEQVKAEAFAAELASAADRYARRRHRQRVLTATWQAFLAVFAISAAVALVAGLATQVHHTAAYDQRVSQQAEQQQEQDLQQAENLQAQPVQFTPAGWVTLYQGGQQVGLVHVRSSRVITDGQGNTYLYLDPFSGQPYSMLLGTTTYLFTFAKPANQQG